MTDNNGRKRGLDSLIEGRTESEVIRTGKAIPAILEILDGLPSAQIENVFSAVRSILRTAEGKDSFVKRPPPEFDQKKFDYEKEVLNKK